MIRRAAAPALPEPQRSALVGEIRRALGLVFTPARDHDLDDGIARAMDELGVTCGAALLQRVAAREPSALAALAAALTVGETYFFRHPEHFRLVRERALPAALERHAGGPARARLWSAGCATGEEAYSLALTALDLLGPAALTRVEVLATDINPAFLARARAGIYGAWSFRDVPKEVQRRWFTGEGRMWRVAPEAQRMVRFDHLNLAAPGPGWPSYVDVLFCRNVLIYFDEEGRNAMLERFVRALAPGGWLILGPSDAPPLDVAGLVPRRDVGVNVYQRDGDADAVPSSRPPPSSRRTSALAAAIAPAPSRTPSPLPPSPLSPSSTPHARPTPRPFSSASSSTLHSRPTPQPFSAASSSALHSRPTPQPFSLSGVAPPERRVGGAAPSTAPGPAGDAVVIGRRLADAGATDEAMDVLERAIGGEPLRAALYVLRATVMLDAGRAGAAARDGQRAAMLEPRSAAAHLILGAALLQEGDAERAARALRNARALLVALPPDAVVEDLGGARAADALAYCARLERALSEPAVAGDGARRRRIP